LVGPTAACGKNTYLSRSGYLANNT